MFLEVRTATVAVRKQCKKLLSGLPHLCAGKLQQPWDGALAGPLGSERGEATPLAGDAEPPIMQKPVKQEQQAPQWWKERRIGCILREVSTGRNMGAWGSSFGRGPRQVLP